MVTVEELIEELMEVEDKTREVRFNYIDGFDYRNDSLERVNRVGSDEETGFVVIS